METEETEIVLKIPKNFYCNICQYECRNKKDYVKHLSTRKHKNMENGNQMETLETDFALKNQKKSQKSPDLFSCEHCLREYKNRSGLWKHNKKCQEKKVHTNLIEKKHDNELVMVLLKENHEFKQMIVEQNKQNHELQKQMLELAQKPTTTINGNNNCNNRFNLNVFLNETCKDAMNITDFVNSLKLTLQDLEKTADVGYIKGITNIIVNGLNELDVSKRPIHCSDIKRETLYIKDNNAWEKDDQEKKKITRAIRHISIRNAKQIGEWTKENNGYNDSSNKKSDKYLKIVSEANGGEPEEINKIISNISNKVIIDKQV